MHKVSIRIQLLLLTLVIMVPVTGMLMWFLAAHLDRTKEDARSGVRAIAENVKLSLLVLLNDHESLLARLAARPQVRALDPLKLDSVFVDFVPLHPQYNNLGLRDSHGNNIYSYRPNPAPPQAAQAFPWFQEGIRSKEFLVGNAFLGGLTNRWVSVLTYPVLNDAGDISGFLNLPLDLLALNEKVSRLVPKNARVTVVDRADSILLRSSDPMSNIGKPAMKNSIDAMRGEGEGFFSISDRDGVKHVFAFVTIPEVGWRIVAGLSEDVVYAGYNTLLRNTVVIALCVLLIALLLAWRFSELIIGPIGGLVAATEKIAAGDVAVRAKIVGPSEIEIVAEQFNRMLDMRDQNEASLRESEKRTQRLLKAANVGLWDWNLITQEVYFSPEWKSQLGYADHELPNRFGEWQERIYPSDLEPTLAAVQGYREGRCASYEVEFRMQHKSGEWLWIAASAELSRNAAGEPVRMMGSHIDITARKQAEAERASLEAQLRESQKMQAIGTLAGGIAHDFNNALATILGNAELARQDSANNPPTLESLEEIRKAGTRARNLVQQILAFSRRQPTARKPIDLAPVVTEATHLLRATLPARLSLAVHCDQVPPVLADASQIEQVLINLGTNAMQAMRNAPGRIDIRLDTVILDATLTGAHVALEDLRARSPERRVRLSVSDNGPGMDAATKERIFEPFFTTKPVGEGTGLGLSVVHGIVQGHEGVITVDSEPGKGTIFTVYLAVAEVDASINPVSPGTEAHFPAPTLSDGPRILYLDDDESLVFLVERLLKRRGYRVAAYTQQEEALQALRADPADFDLVVTDYNMPGMSGLDVARELRAIRPELPVVVTSGFIDETLHNEAAAAGVREVFFKADSVDVFCDAVQRLAQKVQQKTV